MKNGLANNGELRQIPMFKDLSDQEYSQLLEIATTMDVVPEDRVLKQGNTSQNLWVILEGVCHVVRHLADPDTPGKELVLAELKPLDSFGEVSFFHVAPHSATVRAKTQVRVLRIRRDDFDTLAANGCSAGYKLACAITGVMAQRLRRMDEWVARLSPETQDRRVPEWNEFRHKLFHGWAL